MHLRLLQNTVQSVLQIICACIGRRNHYGLVRTRTGTQYLESTDGLKRFLSENRATVSQ